MVQMVDWPVSGLDWLDTGEGGLYAMLIVPSDACEDDPHCHIESDILVTMPDARVSDCGTLWAPYKAEDHRLKFAAHKLLQDLGEGEKADWAMRSYSQDELSESCQVAMHLGSTHESLFRPTGGAFEVQYKDLTGAGQMLYDLVKSAYGRAPMLLTFLDT